MQVGASGDRLLISLDVKAREQKSWFGFGASANIDIWGKPVLDEKHQILRLTDTSLAVESEAAFGLLGAAARAAMPYLQNALAEKAVVDLKPFAADAKKKIDGGARRLPAERERREGVGRGARRAADRHRLRFQDAARDRARPTAAPRWR